MAYSQFQSGEKKVDLENDIGAKVLEEVAWALVSGVEAAAKDVVGEKGEFIDGGPKTRAGKIASQITRYGIFFASFFTGVGAVARVMQGARLARALHGTRLAGAVPKIQTAGRAIEKERAFIAADATDFLTREEPYDTSERVMSITRGLNVNRFGDNILKHADKDSLVRKLLENEEVQKTVKSADIILGSTVIENIAEIIAGDDIPPRDVTNVIINVTAQSFDKNIRQAIKEGKIEEPVDNLSRLSGLSPEELMDLHEGKTDPVQIVAINEALTLGPKAYTTIAEVTKSAGPLGQLQAYNTHSTFTLMQGIARKEPKQINQAMQNLDRTSQAQQAIGLTTDKNKQREIVFACLGDEGVDMTYHLVQSASKIAQEKPDRFGEFIHDANRSIDTEELGNVHKGYLTDDPYDRFEDYRSLRERQNKFDPEQGTPLQINDVPENLIPVKMKRAQQAQENAQESAQKNTPAGQQQNQSQPAKNQQQAQAQRSAPNAGAKPGQQYSAADQRLIALAQVIAQAKAQQQQNQAQAQPQTDTKPNPQRIGQAAARHLAELEQAAAQRRQARAKIAERHDAQTMAKETELIKAITEGQRRADAQARAAQAQQQQANEAQATQPFEEEQAQERYPAGSRYRPAPRSKTLGGGNVQAGRNRGRNLMASVGGSSSSSTASSRPQRPASQQQNDNRDDNRSDSTRYVQNRRKANSNAPYHPLYNPYRREPSRSGGDTQNRPSRTPSRRRGLSGYERYRDHISDRSPSSPSNKANKSSRSRSRSTYSGYGRFGGSGR
ncbi:MAG: hypothetical protein AAF442_06280 [Pseudomonadota bacterium]